MSDAVLSQAQVEQAPLHGVLAEYSEAKQLLAAASKVRDAGYRDWDTFTPYPVHGIDRAMGIKPTILPWIVLCAGLIGGSGALFMQWWMNAYDYKWLVSGKPFWSIPANIPITFELTVLLAALSCFIGMLMLNRLPLPSHPLDHSSRFARATDDHFFLLIQASDPKFDAAQTLALIADTGAIGIEQLPEDVQSSNSLPRGLVFGLVILGSAALVPFALAALARESTTTNARFDIVPDMDFQSKYKAQRSNPFFADGRSMREPVTGTVAVGQLRDDDHLYRGKTPDGAWARTLPLQISVDDATMERGQQRFGIYCTPCHGEGGLGNGIVNQRALGLNEGTWVPPANLTDSRLIYAPVGELFNTISNGVRNMPGYAKQIKPEDRWAVILYVRALQRSQAATMKDVPRAERGALK